MLILGSCNDKTCKIFHSFSDSHNLDVLRKKNLNANPDILLKFFQVKKLHCLN